jgi:hypothetical protein
MMFMRLSEVWEAFTPDLRRVFSAVARENDRARTKAMLGALSDLEGELGEVLSRIETEADVSLIHPETMPDEPGSCPDDLSFSPCVKEALNFFRIHQIRPITPEKLALRLIQIGTGSTIMALEQAGYLASLRQDIEALLGS